MANDATNLEESNERTIKILVIIGVIFILATFLWCLIVGLLKKEWFPFNNYNRETGPYGTVSSKDAQTHEEQKI
jgi:hypothetical protein